MKHAFLVCSIVALAAGVAFAQAPAEAGKAAAAQAGGHTAPKDQPERSEAVQAPSGAIALGSVHISKSVKADGKPLAAGTYQVRVTADSPSPNAAGASQGLERWVEFVQRGQVKGREVVTIVPKAEVGQVQKDAPPAANGSKFEALKGGDYLRLWINKGGNHYLVYFPTA